MALPSGVTTATLTLNGGVDHSGDPVAAQYTIVPVGLAGDRPYLVSLVHAASGTALVPLPERVRVAPDGKATIVLPRTNQAGIIEATSGQPYTGWCYWVEVAYQRTREQHSIVRVVSLTASADLDSLPAAIPTPPPLAPTALWAAATPGDLLAWDGAAVVSVDPAELGTEPASMNRAEILAALGVV